MIIRNTRSLQPIFFIKLGFISLAISLISFIAVSPVTAAQQPKKEPCSEPTPQIFDRVSQAVVFITAKSINPYQVSRRVEHSVGSGFLIDSSGLILTNSHVVFGHPWLAVTLDDGTSLPAQLIGADPIFDLALIQIPVPSGKKLPKVTLGDSSRTRVGEEVMAIGNPLGLNQTLTRGIVSAINRIIPMNPFAPPRPLIQMDTPINPGNSGGPLLDRCGEVIGINTAAIAGAENIGFAIPINLAKSLMPSLLEHGRVIRPWVGFHGQFIDTSLQDLLKIPLVKGFLVEVVEPGSPAEQAGLLGGQFELMIDGLSLLLGGDIITSVNNIRLDSPEKLTEIEQTLQIGMPVSLTVFRKREYQKVDYLLSERPILPWDVLINQSSLASASNK